MRNSERTYYVSPKTRPGDRLSYGDWRDTEGPHTWYDGDRIPTPYVCRGITMTRPGVYTAKGIPLTLIEYATGSDYSGNLCERSNYEVLIERFPWLIKLHGGHGTFACGYLGKRENQNPELIEALDDLERYPLLDEDHHSNLEMEAADQAWEDDGRKDWKRALVKLFDLHEYVCAWCDGKGCEECDDGTVQCSHDEDLIPDDKVDRLYDDCVEMLRGGERYLNEQGDQIYFPIDRIIEDIRSDRPALYRATYNDDNRSINDKLDEIREISLITE